MSEIKIKKQDNIPASALKTILSTMIRIRLFEEYTEDLLNKKEIGCPVHLYTGQEAIAAGTCVSLNKEDYVFSTHRSHGHYISKGGNIKSLMAELFGRAAGCSHGYGGSMHITDPDAGFMGSSAIVAGSVPIAVGAALSAKKEGDGRVSVAFFGDGATDEGAFYESVNIAGLYNLPVIFICENNQFSTHWPLFKRQKNIELYKKIKGFGINSIRVDGNNPIDVFIRVRQMLKRARSGKGPSFIECMTYRWMAHVGPDHDEDIGYRRKADIDYWKARCPIKFLKEFMISNNYITDREFANIESDIKKEIEDAILFAKHSPFPDLQAESGSRSIYA